MLICICDRSPLHERRRLLLRNDVLRTHVFWREGRAELKVQLQADTSIGPTARN